MKKVLAVAMFGLLFATSMAFADDLTNSQGPVNISVTIGAEALFTSPIATSTLTHSGAFTDFTGATPYSISLRTSSGGTGTVTVNVGVITNTGVTPPTVDADLSITSATPPTGGTGIGATALVVSSNKTVATFGGESHVTTQSGTVNWKLLDDPNYSTGTVTIPVTYTVSAS